MSEVDVGVRPVFEWRSVHDEQLLYTEFCLLGVRFSRCEWALIERTTVSVALVLLNFIIGIEIEW